MPFLRLWPCRPQTFWSQRASRALVWLSLVTDWVVWLFGVLQVLGLQARHEGSWAPAVGPLVWDLRARHGICKRMKNNNQNLCQKDCSKVAPFKNYNNNKVIMMSPEQRRAINPSWMTSELCVDKHSSCRTHKLLRAAATTT